MARIACVLLSAVLTTAALGQHAATLEEANPMWVAEWRLEIDRQMALMTSAYNLNEQQQATMRAELERRLQLQLEYERVTDVEIKQLDEAWKAAGGADDAPEGDLFVQRVMEICEAQPLNEVVTATALEATLPPEVAQQGRQNLEELWYRREQLRINREEERQYVAGFKRNMTAAMIASEAPVSSAGKPMPRREGMTRAAVEAVPDQPVIESARVITADVPKTAAKPDPAAAPPPTGATAPVETRRKPDAAPSPRQQTPDSQTRTAPTPMPTPTAGQPDRDQKTQAERGPRGAAPTSTDRPALPPAPEIDEWDKHVDATAKRLGFTDAQITKAQAVLRDLRRRAEQYRKSRSNEYAQARQMSDAKARTDVLKKLNQPLDALFDELKQRLESLATAEQRARAKAAEAPKQKK